MHQWKMMTTNEKTQKSKSAKNDDFGGKILLWLRGSVVGRYYGTVLRSASLKIQKHMKGEILPPREVLTSLYTCLFYQACYLFVSK